MSRIEEITVKALDSSVSANGNTQLKTTSYHADGTAGQLITGTDYVSGKSGIDSMTEALVNIPQSHYVVHQGKHFGLLDYVANVASGATVNFVVTTPNITTWAHMMIRISSSLGAKVDIYAGPTGISGGSTPYVFNSNGNSANTTTLTILKDATIVSLGTRIVGMLAGGGGRQAGSAAREDEWIFRQNTTYALVVTSQADNNDIAWDFQWYEQVSKN